MDSKLSSGLDLFITTALAICSGTVGLVMLINHGWGAGTAAVFGIFILCFLAVLVRPDWLRKAIASIFTSF
jgi:hypothetical protein